MKRRKIGQEEMIKVMVVVMVKMMVKLLRVSG